MKKIYIVFFVALVSVVVFISFNIGSKSEIVDYKNATYLIDGRSVKLTNGLNEEKIANSSSVIKTSYFGNDLKVDLDSDGREDVVFLLTVQTGGSGTFFYVVAGLNKENGFVGSDGFFIGDRIAPQNINKSNNPRHKNVIVVNYADRENGESMVSRPSLGKSAYLKLGDDFRWGIVEPDFEGESR